MAYNSLDQIIRDGRLGLGEVSAEQDALLKAVEEKLKTMQSSTIEDTSEQYRLLVEAHEFLAGRNNSQGSGELVPVPAATLELMLKAALEQRPAPTPVQPTESPVERMQTRRHVVATQASQDFTTKRTLPLAGLGVLAAAVWGTRQTFGANLSDIGTTVWALGASFVVIISIVSLLAASRAKDSDIWRLRRLFDPDIQATALRVSGSSGREFSRALYKFNLARIADGRFDPEWDAAAASFRTRPDEPEPWMIVNPSRALRRSTLRANLSTVDLEGALEDATSLSLARFVEIGAITYRVSLGSDLYTLARDDKSQGAGG
jgi:hypothetical protein